VDPYLARRAVAASLLAGIAADLLFDRVALGINVPIMTAVALALVTWFGTDRRPADRLDLWLPAVALLASLGPALRTDPTVAFLDLWLVLLAVGAWSLAMSGVAVTRQAAATVAWLGIRAGLVAIVGFAWLAGRAGSNGALAAAARRMGHAAPVVRGLVIAVPVIAGFSILLTSADAVFGRALDEALRLPIDVGDLAGRAAFVAVATFLVAGPVAIAAARPGLLAWSGLAEPAGDRPADPSRSHGVPAASAPTASAAPIAPGAPTAPAGPAGSAPAVALAASKPGDPSRAGTTEALVVLGAVDLLFAAFAAVQVLFLFGGADTLATIGMTYSDYARQGYFQLAGVVALAGLLLIGAHSIVGRTRALLVAGLPLLVLTGVILASAALRLRLYQDAYGWTELRFFVAASIAWLAAAVALAIALLLRDRMRWLVHGLAMSAVAITLAVSVIGPQAFVMHQNLARVLDPTLVPEGGHTGFDADYALTLGDDAIPELVATLDRLPASRDRVVLVRALLERREQLERDATTTPWPAWNLAREAARDALEKLPER